MEIQKRQNFFQCSSYHKNQRNQIVKSWWKCHHSNAFVGKFKFRVSNKDVAVPRYYSLKILTQIAWKVHQVLLNFARLSFQVVDRRWLAQAAKSRWASKVKDSFRSAIMRTSLSTQTSNLLPSSMPLYPWQSKRSHSSSEITLHHS